MTSSLLMIEPRRLLTFREVALRRRQGAVTHAAGGLAANSRSGNATRGAPDRAQARRLRADADGGAPARACRGRLEAVTARRDTDRGDARARTHASETRRVPKLARSARPRNAPTASVGVGRTRAERDRRQHDPPRRADTRWPPARRALLPERRRVPPRALSHTPP